MPVMSLVRLAIGRGLPAFFSKRISPVLASMMTAARDPVMGTRRPRLRRRADAVLCVLCDERRTVVLEVCVFLLVWWTVVFFLAAVLVAAKAEEVLPTRLAGANGPKAKRARAKDIADARSRP